MLIFRHTPKSGGTYLRECLKARWVSQVSPDRRVQDVGAWLDEQRAKGITAVWSHWAFSDEDFRADPRDTVITLTRPMPDVVMSLWDYLRGPEWAGRLSRGQARLHWCEAVHRRWWALGLEMLSAEDFLEWLDFTGPIPDLSAAEARIPCDLLLNYDTWDQQWPEFEALVGRKVERLPFRVNESRDGAWRDEMRGRIEIYDEKTT